MPLIAPKFYWLSSPEDEFPSGFRTWSIAKRALIYQVMSAAIPEALQWVRANAPWTDRTGDARALFQVNLKTTTLNNEITFSHGVFYGLYLETHNGGRFAIVPEAVDYWGHELMERIQVLFDD